MEEFELKPLSRSAVPAALEKAEHYRLLNEPRQAESICLDVLKVEPDNQRALVLLVLSLSDQLERRKDAGVTRAREHLARVADPYLRTYYDGILCERRAYAHLHSHIPGARYAAWHWFAEAVRRYEEAEKIRPEGNDDPILRRNTIVRVLRRHPEVRREPDVPETEQMLE